VATLTGLSPKKQTVPPAFGWAHSEDLWFALLDAVLAPQQQLKAGTASTARPLSAAHQRMIQESTRQKAKLYGRDRVMRSSRIVCVRLFPSTGLRRGTQSVLEGMMGAVALPSVLHKLVKAEILCLC